MRRLIAPDIWRPFPAAARGALPLGLSRQAIIAAIHAAQPIAILDRFDPINRHHRLVGMIEIGIVPVLGRRMPRRFKENRIVPIANLIHSQFKWVYPNFVKWPFLILPRLAPHYKFPGGD